MIGAAIDLGSNSFICYIFKSSKDGLVSLDDRLILTRMSEGVDKTGVLAPQALLRAEQAFKEFEQLFLKYGVQCIQAVATSAVRDAKNQSEFLELAERFKIPVRILSGDEEANLTFMGVQNYFGDNEGMIIDIGGGSTEFVSVSNGKIKDRVSLNMGVVRFTERYLPDTSLFMQEESKIRYGIQQELQNNSKLEKFKTFEFKTFLAVSGTPTSAAAVLSNAFDAETLDRYRLDHNNMNVFLDNYAALTLDQRLEKYPFVEAKRADVLPTGVLILEEALRFFNFDSYMVSTKGIRHGLARSMCNSDSGTFI